MYKTSKDKTGSSNSEELQRGDHASAVNEEQSVVAEMNHLTDINADQMEDNSTYNPINFGTNDGDAVSSSNQITTALSNIATKDTKNSEEDAYTKTQQAPHRFSRGNQPDRKKSTKTSSTSMENNDPEILNISTSSKYSRVLPSVIAMQSNQARVSYKGHRRNVSNMSGKPLITSDSYSSTSDISECCYSDDNEDGQATSNRPPRHTPHSKSKHHHHRPNAATADHRTSNNETRRDTSMMNVVHGRYHHNVGDTSSHIIRIEDENDDINGIKYQHGDDGDNADIHIPHEPLKTFVAAVFLFMAFVATTASLAFVHDRVPFHYDPLPDVILDNVKYQPWGLDASEIMLMILVWTTVLITIFHKHRFIVYRRIFLIGGLHYFYRAITMALTVLPVADKAYREDICQPQSNQTSAFVMGQRVLKLISGMGLAINGKHVYCGDYIYSGHTMSLVMAYLIIKEYSPRRWILLHYGAMVIAIAGVVTLLCARGHYSIDVIVAYWITTRIWWIFHTLAKNPNLKEVDGFGRNDNNYLKNLWWWYIFRWFECNVPVMVPHRYNWPIPQKLLKCKPVQYLCVKLRKGTEKATQNLRSNHHNNSNNFPNSSNSDCNNTSLRPHDLVNVATIG